MRAIFFAVIMSSMALPGQAYDARNHAKLAQFYLNELGYNAGTVDGQAGKKTRAAFDVFYKDQGGRFDGTIENADIAELLAAVSTRRGVPASYGTCLDAQDYGAPLHELYSESLDLSQHRVIRTDIPNYGSFTFGEIGLGIGGPPSPEIKGVADFNQDGIDDLILDYFETAVQPLVLMGDPSGIFQTLNYDGSDAKRRHIRNAEVVDVNNDGWLDFVGFTTGDPGNRWVENGHSTNGRKIPRGEADVLLINEAGQSFRTVALPEVRRNDWNHGGTAADLDNDGLIDILPLSEGERERTVPLQNRGEGRFTLGPHEYSREISYYLSSDMDAGDLNGDGFADFVVVVTNNNKRTPSENNEIGTLRIVYGDGDFDFRDNLELKLGTIWLSDEAGREIVARAPTRRTAGASHDPKKILTGNSNIELLDINGDGRLDILEGQYFSTSGLWLSSGFKAYINRGDCFEDQTAKLFPNQTSNRRYQVDGTSPYIHNFHLGDVNGDGRNDLVLQTDGAHADWTQNRKNRAFPFVFINEGDAGYLPIDHTVRDMSALIGLDDLVVGDFNGDGLTDIVGIDQSNGNVEIRLIAPVAPVDWSLVEDRFAGNYRATWSIGNVNQGNMLEQQGIEFITLEKGIGRFEGRAGFQPSPALRQRLSLRYRPSGEVIISGDLDLFDPGRAYPTRFEGDLNAPAIRTTWEEGDLMQVTLERLD